MNNLKINKVPNLKATWLMYKSNFDLLSLFTKMINEYGENFQYGFGAFKGYVINDPDTIKYIQMENWSNFPKSRRYLTFSPLIGESILVSNGENWKKRRQIAQPIFQQRDLLNRFSEKVESSTDKLLESLSGEKNLFEILSLHTFRVITEISFGNDIVSIFDEFHECILKLQKSCIRRALSPVEIMDHVPLPSNITFKKESKKVHRLLDSYIQDRLKNPHEEPIDLLDRYILLNKKDEFGFTVEDIRNELVTMIIAGNETSALTLFWGILEILNDKTIYHKIKEETSSKDLNMPDFEKDFPYLNKCILETLRKYPAVWAVTREVKEPCEYKGVRFKKNDIVVISPYFFHRNKNIWDNPEKFIPERFDKDISDDIYIPFARGPRFCIGKPLALFEIRYTMYHLFKKFSNLSITEGSDCLPTGLINLYPNKKVFIKNE